MTVNFTSPYVGGFADPAVVIYLFFLKKLQTQRIDKPFGQRQHLGPSIHKGIRYFQPPDLLWSPTTLGNLK
jgi:hypothetical protein